jgi:hypothetical protein
MGNPSDELANLVKNFTIEAIRRTQKKSVPIRRLSATHFHRTSSHQFGTDFPRNSDQSS